MTAVADGKRADRAASRYRRFLVLYPRAFRDEFGDDLEQAYRDLLVHSTDGKGIWARVTKDLVGSALRERAASSFPGGRPSVASVLGAIVVLGVVLVIGSPGILLLPALVLVGLPVFALTRFVEAWRIRRATGGSIARQLALGVVSLAPAVALVAVFGGEAGYFFFIALAGSLIVSAGLGVLWAGYTLLRPADGTTRPWLKATLVLVPSIAVLGFIIGASLNSYWNSLGPPGDHSVENASEDSRALWQAAHDGDLAAVNRLTTQTCADPWVKFPYGSGRHNAKGMAETRDFTTDIDAPFGVIADNLGDYQDEWYDRCGRDTD